MQRKLTLLLHLLSGLLVFVAAALAQSPSPESVSDLTGHTWQLVKFQGGDDKTITPDDKSKYTLSFGNDGQVSVRLDCNRGRGAWKSAARNQVEFGPLALTRAMCPPGSMERQIAQQLPNVRTYTMKDGHLFLALMADGGVYEFEPQPAAAPASAENSAPPTEGMPSAAAHADATASPSLEGTYWKLVDLSGTPVKAANEQREAHLVLNSQTHRVAGSGGCNRLMGSYQVEGDALTFGQMAGTMMACAEGMDTEKAFLAALGQVKRWKIMGQHLELSDDTGKLVATFEARQMMK